MRALKICLWITGVLCLLAVVGLFIPFSGCEAVAGFFGIESLSDSPLVMYCIRTMAATFAGIGVYFIILASDPVKYGVLVPFSGSVMVFIGLVCAVTGMMVKMPLMWVMGDSLSCLVLGVLILVFWRRAK